MAFVKDAAKFTTLGLAGQLLGGKKKPASSLIAPQPTMYSTTPYSKPMSMIGSSRGGY